MDGGFARRKLLGILSASWLAQACYAATRLGIPDLLATGPRTAADLAATAGARPPAPRRSPRAPAAAGGLRPPTPRADEPTPPREPLRTDGPGALPPTPLHDGG